MTAKLVGRLVRPAVAISLTAFVLFWRTDPAAVWRSASQASLGWIGLALVLVSVDRLLNALRWLWLLCPIDARLRPPTGSVIRVFLTSTFAGTFLPGTVGGDLVRAYGLAQLSVPGGVAAASVAMDRLLGVLSLLIVAVIGLTAGGASDLASNSGIALALVAVAVICGMGAAVVFSDRAEDWAQRVNALLPSGRVRAFFADTIQAARAYAAFHGRLAVILAASIGVQLLRILEAYCLGRALGMRAPAAAYVEFLPLILLAVLLPISMNGIGTSQAAFVWLFARVGAPESEAFALSVLFLAIGVVGNLPGGLLYAIGPARSLRRRGADPPSAPKA